MSLTVAILMMIIAWLLVAAAMLWGVLRIARRRYTAPASRKHNPAIGHKLQASSPFA
jgi:hypothetical protein